jgi:hypothetical protein
MARGSRLVRKVGFGCLGLVVLFGLLLYVTPAGKAVRDLWGSGIAQEALSPTQMRQYNATTESNLKAIYTALKLYEDSEGQFPDATGWMDAIQNRIVANDMTGAEAQKKLVSPSLAAQAGQFGYAMNAKASGKYHGDLDPKMPLIFDSNDTARNAHGDPSSLLPKPPRAGQNMGIAVDGTILKL